MRKADHFLLGLPSLQAMAVSPSPAAPPAAMPPSAMTRRPQSAGGGVVQRTRALAQPYPALSGPADPGGVRSAASFRTPPPRAARSRPASADTDPRSASADAVRRRAAEEANPNLYPYPYP